MAKCDLCGADLGARPPQTRYCLACREAKDASLAREKKAREKGKKKKGR